MKKLVNFSICAPVFLLTILSTSYQPLMAHYSHASDDPMNEIQSVGNTEVIHNLLLDDIFYNECCDEGVYMTATAIIVINPNVLHVTVRDVTGVGLSTNEQYESIGAQFQTSVFYNSDEEGTFLFRVKMRNDNGCSFNLKGTFHVTVNANGDVTSQFINVETQCKD